MPDMFPYVWKHIRGGRYLVPTGKSGYFILFSLWVSIQYYRHAEDGMRESEPVIPVSVGGTVPSASEYVSLVDGW